MGIPPGQTTAGCSPQNLAWAAGYNTNAIPLAAGVLAPVGFVLPPAVGAILMSISTIVVRSTPSSYGDSICDRIERPRPP